MADTNIGIVMVYTGQGKGKTTAALGTALRAAGHGLKAIVIQFPKADLDYGEYLFTGKYCPFEIVQLNKGKTSTQLEQELRSVIRQTLAYAEEVLFKGQHHVVVLDEIFNAIDGGGLSTEDVMGLISIKPHWVNLILTGERAPKEVVKRADLVTEMIKVKHHFAEGVGSMLEGIDY